jgi:cytochrome c peroxidase
MHNERSATAVVVSALAVLGLQACSQATEDERGYQGPPIPWEHSAFPEPKASRAEEVTLGRLLFYDPILSSDRAVACATCHSEV